MTRSIFDPTGSETERGGGMFSPPEARQISQMPPDVIDGKVEVDESDTVEFDASGDEVNGVTLNPQSNPALNPDQQVAQADNTIDTTATTGGDFPNPGQPAQA